MNREVSKTNSTQAGIARNKRVQRSKAISNESNEQHRPLAGVRVLLVEDNRSFQLYCSMILEDAGALVTVASNGEEGVSNVRQHSFDLVLMDIDMPLMNGMDATRAIRQLDGPNAQVKVMAVTSKSRPDELAAFKQAGMNDALAKPFEAVDLIHKAAHLIGRPMTYSSDHDRPMIDLSDLWEKSRGSSQFVCTMLQIFLEDYPMYLTQLETAVKERDEVEIRKVAHRMKSPAAVIKTGYVWDLLRFFEYLSVEAEPRETITAKLDELRSLSQTIIKQVEQKLEALQNRPE